MSLVSVDRQGLRRVVREFGTRWTSDAADIATYLAAQVSDTSHRDVVGPLLAARGASGVVRVGDQEAAAWGDPDVPEPDGRLRSMVVARVPHEHGRARRPRRGEVVSGGAHWGGGLFIPARDLALIGQLFLNRGIHAGTRLLSAAWVDQSWAPCPVKPEYGYLW